MPDYLLNTQDRQWIDRHAEAVRLGCEFILCDLFNATSGQRFRLARSVPIWFNGDYMLASAVFAQIEEQAPYSQIYEQWEYGVFQSVQHACKLLSAHDARVLWVASGFDSRCEEEIASSASEAVEEARQALYG